MKIIIKKVLFTLLVATLALPMQADLMDQGLDLAAYFPEKSCSLIGSAGATPLSLIPADKKAKVCELCSSQWTDNTDLLSATCGNN